MDAIPFISILVLVFALILMTELFKLKREVRKSTNLSNRIKKRSN